LGSEVTLLTHERYPRLVVGVRSACSLPLFPSSFPLSQRLQSHFSDALVLLGYGTYTSNTCAAHQSFARFELNTFPHFRRTRIPSPSPRRLSAILQPPKEPTHSSLHLRILPRLSSRRTRSRSSPKVPSSNLRSYSTCRRRGIQTISYESIGDGSYDQLCWIVDGVEDAERVCGESNGRFLAGKEHGKG